MKNHEKLTWSCRGWLKGVQVVTGDSQEEVLIFRDKQTELHHNIYIIIIVLTEDQPTFLCPGAGRQDPIPKLEGRGHHGRPLGRCNILGDL